MGDDKDNQLRGTDNNGRQNQDRGAPASRTLSTDDIRLLRCLLTWLNWGGIALRWIGGVLTKGAIGAVSSALLGGAAAFAAWVWTQLH